METWQIIATAMGYAVLCLMSLVDTCRTLNMVLNQDHDEESPTNPKQ